MPNTFVVGAPKCGTTALCDYLNQHPQAFVSRIKEPHYFVKEEMPGKASRMDWNRYQSLFMESSDEHKVRAEGSVWYLYSQTALANIHDFNPDARIIAMLRRPDEMVYSMHNQAVVGFGEDILDFNEAWRVAINGNQRASFPKLCDEPSKLCYDRIARYAEQLERVYRHFPADQVHVVFYDDFKQRTEESYQQVLQFLGLPAHDIDFKRINESRVVRNRIIGRFLRKPPKSVLQLTGLIRKATGIKSLGWRDKLARANVKTVARKKLDESVRIEIVDAYKSDILKLQLLCKRDLSDWLV